MRSAYLCGLIAASALIWATEASAARRHHPVYVEAGYARAECILPWYRFFGYCPEAIDDSNAGRGRSKFDRGRYHRGHHQRGGRRRG